MILGLLWFSSNEKGVACREPSFLMFPAGRSWWKWYLEGIFQLGGAGIPSWDPCCQLGSAEAGRRVRFRQHFPPPRRVLRQNRG